MNAHFKNKNHNNTSLSGDARQDIISVAKELFAHMGLEGTTVKDIADRAQVNISAISYYFKGKEGLYRTCLEEFGKEQLRLCGRFLQPAESKEDFKLRLKMFAEEFLGFHLKETNVCRILSRDFDSRNPIAMEVFEQNMLPMYFGLVKFITEAKKSEFLRHDLDAELTAHLMFAQLAEVANADDLRKKYLGTSLNNKKDFDKTIEHFLRNNLEGIL